MEGLSKIGYAEPARGQHLYVQHRREGRDTGLEVAYDMFTNMLISVRDHIAGQSLIRLVESKGTTISINIALPVTHRRREIIWHMYLLKAR